jgi:lysozyme family protein
VTNIVQLKAKNSARWHEMHIKANRMGEFHKVASRLLTNKDQYQEIEKGTSVPWYVVAVIHEREASGDFTKQLSQGDPLNHVSVHVPRGRGPFLSHVDDPQLQGAFYRGALDALIDCAPHAAKWGDWSVGGALTLLEEYNGLGYAARDRPSPYVWSGTDQYISGKYVRDGVYDPHAVDVQLGCAPLIASMMTLDATINFGAVA